MNRIRQSILGLAMVLASGCAYHGAVYSEYSQFALDVRSTAESSSPIKVDLGYDRGVFAYVPKLNGKNGEACSIISWQNIGSSPEPSGLGSNRLLTVDAAVISGIAANVAAVPESMNVSIVQPNGPSVELQTSGGPGARVATALVALTFGQDVNTAKLRAWIKDPAHRQQLNDWLDQNNLKGTSITHLLNTDKYASVRQRIVEHFNIQ